MLKGAGSKRLRLLTELRGRIRIEPINEQLECIVDLCQQARWAETSTQTISLGTRPEVQGALPAGRGLFRRLGQQRSSL